MGLGIDGFKANKYIPDFYSDTLISLTGYEGLVKHFEFGTYFRNASTILSRVAHNSVSIIKI